MDIKPEMSDEMVEFGHRVYSDLFKWASEVCHGQPVEVAVATANALAIVAGHVTQMAMAAHGRGADPIAIKAAITPLIDSMERAALRPGRQTTGRA